MVQVGLEFQGIVQFVGILLKMMGFVPVLQEITVLFKPPHGQVQLNPLVPGNGFILIPEFYQKRGIDPVGKKYR